jgi:predicted methyltransferase
MPPTTVPHPHARPVPRHRPHLLALLALALASATPALAQSEADEPPAPQEHPMHHPRPHGHEGHAMPHDFSDAERWSAVFDDPARDAWQQPDAVVQLMGLEPGMTVADLGAGTGYFLPHLAPAVGPEGRVLALEVEETLVAHMQERATQAGLDNVEPRHIPRDDPGLADQSVDRVLVVNVWHHLSEREAYARRLLDGLAPGGALFVVEYTLESDMGPPPSHRLRPEEVIAELEAAGFAARIVEAPLEKQYVVVGTRP